MGRKKHIMKENLLVLRDSLEPYRIMFVNTRLQYQKCVYR